MSQPDFSECPEAIQTAVNEWLDERPDDVAFLPVDSMDVLVLSSDADSVAWVRPDGQIVTASVRWTTVRDGE